MLAQKHLKTILDYNPETGIFIRKDSYHKSRIGKITGCQNKDNYIVIWINNKLHYAHRIAYLWITGVLPENKVDHINGVKNDNRWCNLRLVTDVQNSMNGKIRSHNKSGFKGVYWASWANKWRVEIKVNKKPIRIGYFETKREAALAYNEAAIEHFGEYAKLNEVDDGNET